MGCNASSPSQVSPVQMGTSYTPSKLKEDIAVIIEMIKMLPLGGMLGHDSYVCNSEQDNYRKQLVGKLENISRVIGKKSYVTLDEERQFIAMDKSRYESSMEKSRSLVDEIGTDASKWVDHQLWKANERYNVYQAVFQA